MLDYINKDTVANDVRMRRARFEGAFLLVEGRSDQKIFVKFTSSAVTQVIVCRTRSDAIAAIRILDEAQFLGVLAIIDADFDRIEGRPVPSKNVFFTDAHDSEMMMVVCDEAINALLAEFASPEKLASWKQTHPNSLVLYLIEEGAKIGALLLYSLRTNAALDFGSFKNGLRLADFLTDELRVDVPKLIQHVLNRSGRPHAPHIPILNGVHSILADGHSPVDLCRGHDLMDLIGYALRSVIGSCQQADASGHNLEGYLRVAYSRDCFQRTKLWTGVADWEKQNGPYRIFS